MLLQLVMSAYLQSNILKLMTIRPPRKRKRVAACCGVSGLTLAAALFSVLFFFFALQRTGLWSLGRRTGDHDVLSIQDIKRGIIDWAMHWQVGLAMQAATLCDGGCNHR